MRGKLVILSGPLCGESVPLNGAPTAIGRDPSGQLSIPDHLMSRRHCAVELVGGHYWLRDLGSANGTFVNGIPVREHSLAHGDRIRAGDSIFVFLQSTTDATDGTGADDLTTRIARESVAAEILSGRIAWQSHDMVGDSPAMRAVYDCVRKVAASECTVLIRGETGTGKELAARAVHDNSARARGPFVAINCAALTETLLESELFGHEKGAFTGALALKRGKLESAGGGTLFLDEIGELATSSQAKLLRALQHHEFERVGGTRTIKVDVRVIAATNLDLEAAVAAGTFRQDLWYRLNVVSITMPPLRDRRGDIPRLAAHFVAKYARGRRADLTADAVDALCAYDWPGNVRELENAVERAVVLGTSERIGVGDLPQSIAGADTIGARTDAAFHRTVIDTKRKLLLDAIDRAHGNYTAAAKLLGINPTYLHRLVRNLGLRETTPRR